MTENIKKQHDIGGVVHAQSQRQQGYQPNNKI